MSFLWIVVLIMFCAIWYFIGKKIDKFLCKKVDIVLLKIEKRLSRKNKKKKVKR